MFQRKFSYVSHTVFSRMVAEICVTSLVLSRGINGYSLRLLVLHPRTRSNGTSPPHDASIRLDFKILDAN